MAVSLVPGPIFRDVASYFEIRSRLVDQFGRPIIQYPEGQQVGDPFKIGQTIVVKRPKRIK